MKLMQYIGLPYKAKGRSRMGVDCWGLVRLFYIEVFKIDLPSYRTEYITSGHRESVSTAIETNLVGWQKVEQPKFGDLLVFNILGLPLHTAIYIDRNNFLHAYLNTDSCVERLNSVSWNKRLKGAYRWQTK